MKPVDVEMDVIGRLLTLARLIRRRGTPAEAEVVLRYEAMLQKDYDARERLVNQQQELALASGHQHHHQEEAA